VTIASRHSADRNARGMGERREHSPFSGEQLCIPPSSLRGMERPVRSFKSFVRTAPPHSGLDGNKPLPPTPTSPTSAVGPEFKIFPQSTQTTSDQDNTTALWRPPAAWHDLSTLKQDCQASPLFTTRNYTPLLPEPSPDLLDGPEQRLWPSTFSNPRHSNLESIDESTICIPSSPPHRASSSGSATNISMASSSPDHPNMQYITEDADFSSRISEKPDMHNTPVLPSSDAVLRVSNLSTKQKAFASLGMDTRDLDTMQEHWSGAQPTEDSRLILLIRGKRLAQSPSRSDCNLGESSDDNDTNERVQQLGSSQDYHNESALDHIVSKESVQVTAKSRPNQSSYEYAMNRPPLDWRKHTGSPAPSNYTSNSHKEERPYLESRRRYRKLASWTHIDKQAQISEPSDLDNSEQASFTNTSAVSNAWASKNTSTVSIRKQNTEAGVSRSRKKDLHFSDIIPQVKDFISTTKRAQMHDNAISGALASTSPLLSSSSGPAVPLSRLPSGLAIVRQLPTPPPPLRSTSALDMPQPMQSKHWNSHNDFSAYGYPPKQRLSFYSQQTDLPVEPAVAIDGRSRTSVSFVPSPQSQSSTSSPPTSPLAHEIALPRIPPPRPRTPPLLPRAPPPSFSPWSKKSEESVQDQDRADSATEEEPPHRRSFHVGIFDRARDAREAWKRHSKDAKHAKLKKSIRILGPTDPTVVAQYVKREGRMPAADGGGDGSRVPGYMVAGPI
jgi:hypothetical protein